MQEAALITDNSPKQAYEILQKALNQSEKVRFYRGRIKALTRLGNWYFGNDVNTAIVYGNRAMYLYDSSNLNDINVKAPIDVLLAEAYDEKGKQDSSAYFFYRLSDEIESGHIKDANLEINVYIKLTVFWLHLDYDSTTIKNTIGKYVQTATAIAASLPENDQNRYNSYFLKGLYFTATLQYDSSRYYFEQYLLKHKGINLPRRISTLLNTADCYLLSNRPAKALPYIEQVRQLGNNPQYKTSLAFFLSIADLMRDKVLFQEKKYAEVTPLLEEYISGTKRSGNLLRHDVVDAHQMLAECYEHAGNYQKALEENKAHLRLRDQMVRKDKLDMVNRLEVRFRIAQKDKELAVQKLAITEAQNKMRRKNFWIGIITLIALGLTAIFVLLHRNSLHKQGLQQEKINGFQKQMEIIRLNATITGEEKERKRLARELHDGIGGILAAAKINFELAGKTEAIREEADFKDGLKLLEEAATELRQTAHNMLPDVLESKGLLQALRLFCVKMGNNSETELIFQHYGIEKKFNTIFELSIYRIVQELVHNVVKHAKAKHAIIQMEYTGNGLSITIEDDGVGMPENITEQTRGIGLTNIYDRVQHAGGIIDIHSSPDSGTSIYLEFEKKPDITNEND
ncbi:sensor histidine protein kinase UhpB, glucose-6-phosphate specific [Filimonas lacunae]|nr:sensor histidine protein kinase UhpB, glucose-6-phosphate specific [Filimonas lacunae]